MRKRAIALAALAIAVLGALAVGAVTYADGQADQRRAMRERFAREMKTAAADAAAEQDAAVAVQQRRDAKKLKATVRQLKAQARRQAERSFTKGRSEGYSSGQAAGYASGQVAGYADGSADGYRDGLTEGSDQLDCSDDPDVYWLPACW